jgi:hypothetical protein
VLLNRSQLPWAWFTLVATAVSVAAYVMVFYPGALPVHMDLPAWLSARHRLHHSVGNSPLGLLYGCISYAIFIFAVLLNTRRKFPSARLGSAKIWLRAHIWLTILTLPLVFMHAAFHFGGMMTSSLMWLYLLVMFSGFYGLALQQFMPALMKARLPLETVFEEIPFLSQQLLASALKMRGELRTMAVAGTPSPAASSLAEAADPSVTAILKGLEHDVLPFLAARKTKRYPLARPRFAAEFFRELRVRVAPDFQERVDLLAQWTEERRQMDMQLRYHHWLHGWLLVHIPASFLLIILTGWHAVVTLFLY